MTWRISETDPAKIADLWERVRSTMPTETRAMAKGKGKANDGLSDGRGKSRGGRVHGGGGGSRGGGQNNSRKRRRDADEDDGLIEEQTLQTKLTKVTSHNLQFYSLVLHPRRIVEMDVEPNKGACSHFETTAPPIDYTTIAGLYVAGVWLSLSDNEVEHMIEEYEFMTHKGVCEQEYVSFAMEKLFRRQRRSLRTPTDRKWRAERMLQLVSPPAEFWVAPPCFEEGQDFKFDLRPDCSYWLSLTGFSPDYRGELINAVYVHENWVTCPYLTIEFQKHGQSDLQAKWPACAAASMGLYNRYLLKCKALAIGAKDWTDSDKSQMKHYMLTFVGATYNVWVLRARFSEGGSWDGCFIRDLRSSEFVSKSAVRRLESWINEIHRWGLSIHADGCQADVKTILTAWGVEVSPVNDLI